MPNRVKLYNCNDFTGMNCRFTLGWIASALLLLSGSATAQSAERRGPAMVAVSEAQNGFVISSVKGSIPSPSIFTLKNPERLVLDFAGATLSYPNSQLRTRLASLGVRMAEHPDENMTRIVFDIPRTHRLWIAHEGSQILLTSADPIPTRNAVSVAVTKAKPTITAPIAVSAKAPTQTIPQVSQPVKNYLFVDYRGGLIRISARGVSFGDVLSKVIAKTGAELNLQVPLETAPVVFEVGPVSPTEAMRQLFAGTPYNYVMVSRPNSNEIASISVTGLQQFVQWGTISGGSAQPSAVEPQSPPGEANSQSGTPEGGPPGPEQRWYAVPEGRTDTPNPPPNPGPPPDNPPPQ